MIRLTDEEIIQAIDKANGSSEWREGWEIQDVLEEQDRSIAKAQLKKVVEWGNSGCPHGGCLPGNHYEFSKSQCPKCWQTLLEETK